MKTIKCGLAICFLIALQACGSDESTLGGNTWSNGRITMVLNEDGTGLTNGAAMTWRVDQESQALSYSYQRTGNTYVLYYEMDGGDFVVNDTAGWGDQSNLGRYTAR